MSHRQCHKCGYVSLPAVHCAGCGAQGSMGTIVSDPPAVIEALNAYKARIDCLVIAPLTRELDEALTRVRELEAALKDVLAAFEHAPLSDTWWFDDTCSVLEYIELVLARTKDKPT